MSIRAAAGPTGDADTLRNRARHHQAVSPTRPAKGTAQAFACPSSARRDPVLTSRAALLPIHEQPSRVLDRKESRTQVDSGPTRRLSPIAGPADGQKQALRVPPSASSGEVHEHEDKAPQGRRIRLAGAEYREERLLGKTVFRFLQMFPSARALHAADGHRRFPSAPTTASAGRRRTSHPQPAPTPATSAPASSRFSVSTITRQGRLFSR